MIDPKGDIKKLYHETKVSSEQPSSHKFTSRGIIVTGLTFGTSDAADKHLYQFKKGEFPSYDPIFDPKEITSI